MRHQQWVKRLTAVEAEWRNAPLEYGKQDCGRMAARCVDAVLGTDHESQLTYLTPREAVALIRKHRKLMWLVTHLIGPPKAGPPVRRGDIGQVGRHSLAVCFGPHTLAITQLGMRPIDRRLLQPWHWEVG